jgi:8-oxo-dGTP pyrophosphatase MutT (NUDIX family)
VSADAEIQAAGGVVVDERDGTVLVVHRPRYGDWSLPKGHLDPGETFEQAALREVFEETGVRCQLREELEPARYEVGGRPKIVRWWRMSPTEETDDHDDEVDEVMWVAPEDAIALLDYEHDRALVRQVSSG